MARTDAERGARLILIEGIPGSGKSSLAEWLCARIAASGRTASWVPELQPDHPVIDKATMRTARQPGYADRCIDRWAAFAKDAAKRDSPEVCVLEACLFQSTVRFLIEYERPAEDCERYVAELGESLAPLRPQVVYLTQTDTEVYLREEVVRRKGADIVSRIAAYSATTPYAVSRGLEGQEAFVSLYISYRIACDSLVKGLAFPVLEVDTVRFDEAAVRERVGSWTDGATMREPGTLAQ